MATKKDKLMQDYLNAPIVAGDVVQVVGSEKNNLYKVISVSDSEVVVLNDGYSDKKTFKLEEVKKYTERIGADPFVEVEKIWFMTHLSSIGGFINDLKNMAEVDGKMIPEYNFYPVVFDKNENRHEYQRPYVWGLEEKQDFIESIYNEIDCGVIVLRERSWDYIKSKINTVENVGFFDVIDGKQRLLTLKSFIEDQFPDRYGNYYSDLSVVAKRKFGHVSTLKKVVLPENATDKDAINAFLKVNYTGKPMSRDYRHYIEEIKRNLI